MECAPFLLHLLLPLSHLIPPPHFSCPNTCSCSLSPFPVPALVPVLAPVSFPVFSFSLSRHPLDLARGLSSCSDLILLLRYEIKHQKPNIFFEFCLPSKLSMATLNFTFPCLPSSYFHNRQHKYGRGITQRDPDGSLPHQQSQEMCWIKPNLTPQHHQQLHQIQLLQQTSHLIFTIPFPFSFFKPPITTYHDTARQWSLIKVGSSTCNPPILKGGSGLILQIQIIFHEFLWGMFFFCGWQSNALCNFNCFFPHFQYFKTQWDSSFGFKFNKSPFFAGVIKSKCHDTPQKVWEKKIKLTKMHCFSVHKKDIQKSRCSVNTVLKVQPIPGIVGMSGCPVGHTFKTAPRPYEIEIILKVPQCLFCPFSRLIPCKKIQEGGIHLIV
ncbi:putative signal peptide protein [Puccinia sorghi]|uniref:Putative signal peptide protein n=1 Tax=Puccinia sorghi TaxID=27349 RepID=A0A0L6VAK5_9BASI|nr:putative signal peptide protein [Puccinia sorghi]